MSNIQKHLSLLGHRVRDAVTGLEGVVSSISFDLYGCVQALINPGLDKDGKHRDLCWHDVSRLIVQTKKPVIPQPNFVEGRVAEGRQGAAEKPAP